MDRSKPGLFIRTVGEGPRVSERNFRLALPIQVQTARSWREEWGGVQSALVIWELSTIITPNHLSILLLPQASLCKGLVIRHGQ